MSHCESVKRIRENIVEHSGMSELPEMPDPTVPGYDSTKNAVEEPDGMGRLPVARNP